MAKEKSKAAPLIDTGDGLLKAKGEVHVLEGQNTFRFGPTGEEFSLPALDTLYELEDMARAVSEVGGSHKDYLGRVRKWMREEHGVELSYDAADQFGDLLGEVLAKEKARRRAAIQDAGK